MRRVLIRWCTLAGVMAGLLGLTVQASAAAGWTVVTPPAFPPGTQNYLKGSFAISDTGTWVVGDSQNPSTGTEVPIALHWNGTAWSSVSTPAPSGSTPDWAFLGVGASSARDAWAVGEQSSGRIHNSLYEHWNGRAWSVVAGPNEGVLNAVLDFSPANAWAFADFNVLHWNGTAWSVVSGPLPALKVSADGPNDIWGVSVDDIVTHYNGTSWSSTTLSSPSGTPYFEGVMALSPTDVWVAGTNGTGPVLEHFNGTSWRPAALPPGSSSDGLNLITARSRSDVWVFSNTGSPQRPLLARWNGSSWRTSRSPLPSNTLVQLGSAATSPSHVWLFGTNISGGHVPLILSHS